MAVYDVSPKVECRKLFLDIVFLPEPFNASGGVNKFLLAGEEGVAG